MPRTSLVHLVYELAAFGAFGLILAADRYNPKSGNAFITYANYWVKKFISLYLEEISSIVPRTGHMGDDEPRRSVMDLVDAALDGRRLYRGKAAGGMAFFDSALSIPGPNPGDKEIEVVGSEGITDPNRLDYLQRRVGLKDYPWIDMGAYQPNGALWPISELVEPARCKQIELLRNEFGIVRPMNGDRLALPGHTGGKADDVPPQDDSYTPEEIDAVEFTRGVREPRPVFSANSTNTITRPTYGAITAHGGGELCFRYGPSMRQAPQPAEVCYISKQRPDRQYNSREQFNRSHSVYAYWHVDYRGVPLEKPILKTKRQPRTPSHEIEILRRADAVQTSPGASRRRGRRITQAHDVPVSILPASSAREVGA